MMTPQKWMRRFRKHLRKRYMFTRKQAAGYAFTDYEDYYNDGYSPEDACDEDMSYADWEPSPAEEAEDE